MGNLESKLTPYYEIVNEETSNNASPSGKSFQDYNFNPNNLSIWSIKRANVNNTQNKNATLFEFVNNCGKNSDSNKNKQNLQLALNQIKIIKTVRHPNIVKYLYSEEPSSSHNLKCLLITESIRPLNSLIETLNKEQIIRGLYCITSSLTFLHEKLKISHNNVNKSCIYSNSKQIWKLSDFELSISFNDLSKETLRQIYDLKCKNSITPEEESVFGNIENNRYDLDLILKQYPHTIDAYAWSFLMIDILFNNDKKKSYSSNQKLTKTNSTMNMIDDIEGDYGDEEYEDESLKDLELYLNKDPQQRPNMNEALNLKLFDLYRDSSTNNSSYLSENNTNDSSSDIKDISNQSNFDPFKLNNLDDLENNLTKLIEHLNEIVKSEKETKKSAKALPNLQLNEKLIDFLLSPFMFFSTNVTRQIFPSLFIPKEEYKKFKNNSLNMIYYHNCLNNSSLYQEENSNNILKPFIDLDKYKAIVLPRILNLFSMRSMQIRIVLLEYFPFYIQYINDFDTLKYEILPEVINLRITFCNL
jgi:serine/threonine protein kinase